MEEIKIDIKTEHIQALLEGKKLVLDYFGQPKITLIPDRCGVFLTYERFAEMRKKILMYAMTTEPEFVLKEVFGEDLYEKVMKEKPISNNLPALKLNKKDD